MSKKQERLMHIIKVVDSLHRFSFDDDGKAEVTQDYVDAVISELESALRIDGIVNGNT